MKKHFALALVVAGLAIAGCSSDSDDDDGNDEQVVDTGTNGAGDGNGGTGGEGGDGTEDGAGGGNETVTDGPDVDAGPVELTVANDATYSDFYTLFDAVFGGETFDERETPEEAWTIFVPTNTAFEAAGAGDTPDDDKLLLLRRHVISDGALSTAELAALSEVIVNTGDSYAIGGEADALTIGGAPVLGVIAQDENTIVYGIDGVLQAN